MEGGISSGSGSSDVGIPTLPSLSVTYWRTPCLLGPGCQLLNGFGHVRGSSSVVYSLYFYFFSFSFWLREVRIDLVRTSTILHVRIVPKIQPAPCYIPKIQISCSQNWRLHNPCLAIPKLQRARKLPPAAKSRQAKSPF